MVFHGSGLGAVTHKDPALGPQGVLWASGREGLGPARAAIGCPL